jgi:6-phosphogluconolactonase
MNHTVYIGTYTNSGGKGIYRAELADDGKLSLIDAAQIDSPSYIIFSSDKKYIYASNETREIAGVPGGGVTAFEVLGDGALKMSVCRPTGGGSSCHLLEHGGYLYCANYGSGSVTVFPLDGGIPGDVEFVHQHEGSGPDARRQKGPHAHQVMNVPGTDVVCVTDLGIDQTRFYRKDGKSLALVQALQFEGGDGPRHAVFTADGRFGWVVTELSNYVYSIKFDKEWAITGKYSTLPPGFAGESACAAIRLAKDEKTIAASNRFSDSVAVYDVDGATGLLSLKGIYPVGGATPRDIDFSPDGKWLLSANQDSDTVTALSVGGGFTVVEGATLSVPRPTCILF